MRSKANSYANRVARRWKLSGGARKNSGDLPPVLSILCPERLGTPHLRMGHRWPDEVRNKLRDNELRAAIKRMRGLSGRDKDRLRSWAGRNHIQ